VTKDFLETTEEKALPRKEENRKSQTDMEPFVVKPSEGGE